MTETRAPYETHPVATGKSIILQHSVYAVRPDEDESGGPYDYARHPMSELQIETIHGHRVVPDGHIQIDMHEYGMLELSPEDAANLGAALLNALPPELLLQRCFGIAAALQRRGQ